MFQTTFNRQSLEYDHNEIRSSVSDSAKSEALELLASMCESGNEVQKQARIFQLSRIGSI